MSLRLRWLFRGEDNAQQTETPAPVCQIWRELHQGRWNEVPTRSPNHFTCDVEQSVVQAKRQSWSKVMARQVFLTISPFRVLKVPPLPPPLPRWSITLYGGGGVTFWKKLSLSSMGRWWKHSKFSRCTTYYWPGANSINVYECILQLYHNSNTTYQALNSHMFPKRLHVDVSNAYWRHYMAMVLH